CRDRAPRPGSPCCPAAGTPRSASFVDWVTESMPRCRISAQRDRYAAPVPEAGATVLPAVGVRPVLVAAFGTYRRRFGLIAGASLVVFGISAGFDVLTEAVNDRAS